VVHDSPGGQFVLRPLKGGEVRQERGAWRPGTAATGHAAGTGKGSRVRRARSGSRRRSRRQAAGRTGGRRTRRGRRRCRAVRPGSPLGTSAPAGQEGARGISHGAPVRPTPTTSATRWRSWRSSRPWATRCRRPSGSATSGTERKHDLPVPSLSRVCRTSTGRYSGYRRRVSDELLSRRASRSLTGSRRCGLGAAAPSSAH
jgi:hypothetical protein